MKKSKKIPIIVWSAVAAFILAITVALNALSLTIFDPIFTLALGASEGRMDTSNVSGNVGELDTEYVKSDYPDFDSFKAAETKLGEEIAEEGIVLLKNDGALPLKAGTDKLSLWGYASYNFMYSGTGSGGNGVSGSRQQTLCDGITSSGLTVNDALWRYYSESNYSTAGRKGTYQANKKTDYTYGLGGTGLGSITYGTDLDWTIFEIPYSTVSTASAVMDEAEGTVAVYTLSRFGGEGADLPRYMDRWTTANSLDRDGDAKRHYLQPNSVELDMLAKLDEKYDKVVVLLNSNNPMELNEIERYADAVVWVPGVGTVGTRGLGRLLSGAANFSGRTPDTFAVDAFSSPAMQNMGDFRYSGAADRYYYVTYLEGIYVGYKYYETRYEDCVLGRYNAQNADVFNKSGFDYKQQVKYPFGYGLSYTKFEWSDFSTAVTDDKVTVNVRVRNVGNAPGKEVVQIYAQAPYVENGVEKAAVQLVGFAKTDQLAVDGETTVTVSFDKTDLKSYDYKTRKTYVMDAGTYYVTAARNAHEAVNNILAAKGKTVADGMDGAGIAEMSASYDWGALILSKDGETDTEITNRLAHADNGFAYLTRSDWAGTYPQPNGTQSGRAESAIGERDGFQFVGNCTDEVLALLKSKSSLNPDQAQPDKIKTEIVNGTGKSAVELIDLRGLGFSDPAWEELLDRVTLEDMQTEILMNGYTAAPIDVIGKPAATGQDGPSGWSAVVAVGETSSDMIFPCEIVLAASFNAELSERFGTMMGNSALCYKQYCWLAPAMNIHRTPFAGRNFEYYSEDPTLSGFMGARTVYGASSKGLITYMKHFALNDQEGHREEDVGLVTWCNEQAAREIYLKPFEMSAKNGTVKTYYYELDEDGNYNRTFAETPACMGMMTSFNRIGPTWTGGDYNLITEIVRKEWGFNGLIITDFQNTNFMYPTQWVYAGADTALQSVPIKASFKPGESSATYHYARQAMHRILYSIANSAAMNGYIHGARYIPGFAYYKIILIVWDVVALGVCALAAIFIVRTVRRKIEDK